MSKGCTPRALELCDRVASRNLSFSAGQGWKAWQRDTDAHPPWNNERPPQSRAQPELDPRPGALGSQGAFRKIPNEKACSPVPGSGRNPEITCFVWAEFSGESPCSPIPNAPGVLEDSFWAMGPRWPLSPEWPGRGCP